jgi:hypothetical protein
MDKGQILLCIYTFPPIGGPRSFRWVNLVKELHQHGWQIDVLTTKPSIHDSFYDASLLKELSPKIRVFRTCPGIYYSLLHLRSKPIRGFPKTTTEWLPFGLIRGFSLLRCQKYSAIISSALPFVGHLVGYILKLTSNIPWIADYGDPLGFNPLTSRVKRYIGRFIEKHMLKDADGIIVPFEEMRMEFLEFYPFLKGNKIRVIGQSISEKYDRIKPLNFKKKFVISYTGSFYKDVHEPYQFFQALSLLRGNQNIGANIEVIIAGNTEQKYISYASRLKLSNFTKFIGQIAYDKAISILKGSSVILYIGGKRSDYHFPSKIVGYAASGRPIIAIRQSVTDLGSDFIEKNKLGLVVPNNKEEIAKAIHSLFTLWKDNNLDNSFNRIPKKKLLWRTKGKELEEFLLSIINKNQK